METERSVEAVAAHQNATATTTSTSPPHVGRVEGDEETPTPLGPKSSSLSSCCGVVFSIEKGLTIHRTKQSAVKTPTSEDDPGGADIDIEGHENDGEQQQIKKMDGSDSSSTSTWALQDANPSSTFDIPSYALGAIIIGVLWLLLYSALPYEWMEPGGSSPVFDPIAVVIFSTFMGKVVCKVLQLPALVGIIWFAILWGHIYKTGYLVSGIPAIVYFVVGRIGLTTILVRAGFALSWNLVRGVLFNAIALSLLPLSIEAISHAVVARYVFYDEFDGGDWKWAFLQGFLCSVVSAAITVPGTIALQADGYQRGVPPLILSSVGLDTATGVWIVSFILSLIFDSGSQSLGLKIALGPIQLIGGVFFGVVIGIMYHFIITRVALRNLVDPLELRMKQHDDGFTTQASQLSHHEQQQPSSSSMAVLDRYVLASFILIALAAVFLGNHENLAGGGTILAITFGATVSHMWGYRIEQQTKDILLQQHPEKEGEEVEDGDVPLQPIAVPSEQQQHHSHHHAPDSHDDVANGSEDEQTMPQPTSGSSMSVSVQPQTPPPSKETINTGSSSSSQALLYHNKIINDLKKRLGGYLGIIWDMIVLGPLFAMSGARVKLSDIFNNDFFWKGLVVFICAAIVRMIVSCACGFKMGLSKKEVAFIGLGWLGKASVQAAMGSIAYQSATTEYDNEYSLITNDNSSAIISAAQQESLDALSRRVVAAQTVQNTSILFILISAPLCAIFVSKLGPTMLTKGNAAP